jgi:hypothetical protein
MASYIGPATLVLDGQPHHVAVNLHAFVDLAGDRADGPGRAWRGVVVDAAFTPPAVPAGVPALVALPDGREAAGRLTHRRLEGHGPGPFG